MARVSHQARTLGDAVPVIVRPVGRYIDGKAWNGKTGKEMRAAEEASRDERETVTVCGKCPDWRHEGRADHGRDAFQTHQAAEHPTVKRTRRQGHTMHVVRAQGAVTDAAQRAEAMVEVERRLRTTHADKGPA